MLLDSLKKRCNFLEASIEATGLTNAKVVWGRAEVLSSNRLLSKPIICNYLARHHFRNKYDWFQDAARGELRESCHVAVARAVAELRILC